MTVLAWDEYRAAESNQWTCKKEDQEIKGSVIVEGIGPRHVMTIMTKYLSVQPDLGIFLGNDFDQ